MFDFSFLGYFGESVPYSSGLTNVIKGHGDVVREFGGRGTDFEMNRTSKDGIILIRNPFEAIYSYRNYITHFDVTILFQTTFPMFNFIIQRSLQKKQVPRIIAILCISHILLSHNRNLSRKKVYQYRHV